MLLKSELHKNKMVVKEKVVAVSSVKEGMQHYYIIFDLDNGNDVVWRYYFSRKDMIETEGYQVIPYPNEETPREEAKELANKEMRKVASIIGDNNIMYIPYVDDPQDKEGQGLSPLPFTPKEELLSKSREELLDMISESARKHNAHIYGNINLNKED